ncbi:4648_t:CDS:2, partial [Racocetra fulgida]
PYKNAPVVIAPEVDQLPIQELPSLRHNKLSGVTQRHPPKVSSQITSGIEQLPIQEFPSL